MSRLHPNVLPTTKEEFDVWLERYLNKLHRHQNPVVTRRFLDAYHTQMKEENIPEYLSKNLLRLMRKSYNQKSHDKVLTGLLDDPFLLDVPIEQKYNFSLSYSSLINDSKITELNRSELFLLAVNIYRMYCAFRVNPYCYI